MAHLGGLENHSGQNGLSTFAFAGAGNAWWDRIPFSDRLSVVSIEGVQRSYGNIIYPPSQAVALQAWRAQTPFGAAIVKVAVDANLPPRSVGASGILRVSLLYVFRLVRDLVQQRAAGVARFIVPLLDNLMRRLPDIGLYGAIGIGAGVSSQGDGYVRLTTAGGISVNVGGPPPSGASSGAGAYAAAGRGWQITLRNWQGHVP